MGTLLFSELLDELKSHLGNRGDLTDARLTRFLNIAQDRVSRRHDFEEMQVKETISIVKDVQDFDLTTLTATVKEIYSVVALETNDEPIEKLIQINTRDWDKRHSSTAFLNSKGDPIEYVRWSNALELWRTPDRDMQLQFRFIKFPTAFSGADAQKSDFTEKDDILILLAASWAFQSLGEYDRSKQFFINATSSINVVITEDQREPDKDIVPPWEEGGHSHRSANLVSDPFVNRTT